MPIDDEMVIKIAKTIADEGRLMEAGWIGFKSACIPEAASDDQLDEMRMAFMAGAQHLFGSMMTILDPGEEMTAADEKKMELISDELNAFTKELEQRVKAMRGCG